MTTRDPALPPPVRASSLRRWGGPAQALDAVADAFDGVTGRLASRLLDATWSVLHVFGAHRWRDGWETNLERGYRQYRGSRCTICDAPWEGW